MNAKNVRSVMNVNRLGAGAGLFGLMLAATFAPSCGFAAGAAPGMDGVKEVVLQPVQFSDPKAADMCGLSRDDITHVMLVPLKSGNVPAMPASDMQPPIVGIARIELNTEIYTLNSASLDCISWVEVTATSKSNAMIPPIDTQRSVIVQYWHQGAMISGSQALHQRDVDATLQKMAQQFAKQYQLDQPLPLH